MTAALEFINGRASFAGRKPAWHKLGTVIDDLTFDEAMEEANLKGWNVRALSLKEAAIIPGVDLEALQDQVIVRNNPGTGMAEAIAMTGGDYTTVQNEASLGIGSHLEGLGWTVETAGSIRGGRQVFMTLAHKGHYVLDPEGSADEVQPFITLASSHDGSLSNQAAFTPIRVVCANTLDYGLQGATRVYKVKHTGEDVKDRLAQAQQVFLKAQGYFDKFMAEAEELLRTPMSTADFIEVATTLYPKPEKNKGAITRWESKIDFLGDLFTGSSDEVETTTDNITGTAWAGLNALTEAIDWHRTARGGDGTSLLMAASGFDSNVHRQKEKIRETVLDWAAA